MKLQGELVWFAPEAFKRQSLDTASQTVGLSVSGHWHIEAETMDNKIDFEINLGYSCNGELHGRWGRTACRTLRREWEILFGRADRTHVIETPVGKVPYEQGYGINDFRVNDPSSIVGVLPEIWERISKAPGNALANMKVVPAARALTRGTYHLGPELFRGHFRRRRAWASKKKTPPPPWPILDGMSKRCPI